MVTPNKEMAIQKIKEMPTERVSKVLIFMAGMEAEHIIDKECKMENQRNSTISLEMESQVKTNRKPRNSRRRSEDPNQLSIQDICRETG